MTRLVNETRAKISLALLTNRFQNDVEKLAKRWGGFALEVYSFGYTPGIRKALAISDKGYYQDASHVKANIAGKGVSLHFNGWNNLTREIKTFGDTPPLITKRLKFQHAVDRFENQNDIFKCDAEHHLSSEFDIIANEQSSLQTLINTTSKELTAVLDSYHTIEKLVDAWPEIKVFIPAEVIPAPANLPAVPIASLTEMLGLSK